MRALHCCRARCAKRWRKVELSVVATAPAAGSRILGFWMCTALVVGNIIGTGIFVMPAALAPYGLNAVTGWGVTALGCLFLAIVLGGPRARLFPGRRPLCLPHPRLRRRAGLPRHVVLLDFDSGGQRRHRDRRRRLPRDVLPGTHRDAELVRRHGDCAGVVLRTNQPARRTPGRRRAGAHDGAEAAAAAGRGGAGVWLLVQYPGRYAQHPPKPDLLAAGAAAC